MTKKVRYDTGSDVGNMKVVPDPPTYVPRARWLPFPGFSFIFNNPGRCLKTIDNYQLLHIPANHLSHIDLYSRISAAVTSINPDALAQHFQFFALPASTYHVTVWDGINKGNAGSLNPDSQRRFAKYFERDIADITRTWPPLGTMPDYTKRFHKVAPIRFRYLGLRARASTVLLAELETDPADADSCRALEDIHTRRDLLDEEFASYGKPANYPLRPHVAIGYFADSALGDRALSRHMDTWMTIFDEHVRGSTIEFRDIGLYAFTDMVTYFKPLQE